MVMDCIVYKKLYFIILSRRKIRNISLLALFYMVMGCNGLMKKVLLSRRKTSFYAKFQVNFYMVVACIIIIVRTISKMGSIRVTNILALPRKKTGLLENIRVHWCYG